MAMQRIGFVAENNQSRTKSGKTDQPHRLSVADAEGIFYDISAPRA